jgi:diadenosine tetraphosphate (Ap4A) HIT family hydrolase
LPGESSIIYEDEYLFVAPDIAPVISGHFLIVLREHENCFAIVNDEVRASLERAKEFLTNNVFKGKRHIFFEHGSVTTSSMGGSCIDHAHVHAVPMAEGLDVDDYIQKCGFFDMPREVYNSETRKRYIDQQQPYIAYQYAGGEFYSYAVNALPSQFFRIMLGHLNGVPSNWKSQYKTEENAKLFHETLEMAKGAN